MMVTSRLQPAKVFRVIWILLISTLVSTIVTLLVIRSAHHHARWTADHDQSGPQKMHAAVVPRIGGIGIFVGLFAGISTLFVYKGWHSAQTAYLFVLCALPVFAAGLAEDLLKVISPTQRLLAAALSAGMGIYFLNGSIDRTGWDWFDTLIVSSGVYVLLTVFAVSGVIHAINIIDGMNGLASMSVAIKLLALCYVAEEVGDMLIASIALAGLGACLGFFLWNYPRGLIFLGDGGAYFLGFLIAELGLVLVHRQPEVSPLMPLALVGYPVFETLFTMYRRKVLRGHPVSQPDGIHLHTLIYRRLMRWAVGSADARALTQANSRTSPYLWALSSVSVLPAAIWWDNSWALVAAMLVFVLVYLRVYWRIVRFKTPRWLRTDHGQSDL